MSQVRQFTASFYKVAGISSIGSGLTTFAVHLVPLAWRNVTTLEQQVGLRANPLYLSRLWMVYLHLFLVVIAMVGVALRKIRVAPGPAILGLIGYVFFAFTESMRVSLALFALNASWRATYASTTDETIRASMHTLLLAWPGINDALFVLFSLGFAAGNFFFALATWKSWGIERAVSFALLIWALIGAYGIVQGFVGPSWLPPPPEWLSYTFQPAVRFLIGAWLLRASPDPDPRAG